MYALNVPVKCGFTWFNPKQIFITCPRIPTEEFVNHNNGAIYEDIQ